MTTPLARCLGDPGYTPRHDELPALLRELSELESDAADRLERVLARAGGAARDRALELLPAAPAPSKARLYSLLARLIDAGTDERLFAAFAAGLGEDDARARRYAASALGKLGDARAEPPLLRALPGATPDFAKALVDALGKIGGEASLDALSEMTASDADLLRRVRNARALIARRKSRGESSALVFERELGAEFGVIARCRGGLEEVLASELADHAARVLGRGEVECSHRGTLSELLKARVALDFGLRLAIDRGAQEPATRIARTLAGDRAHSVFRAWTSGRARFRLDFLGGGAQRAVAWSVAREVERLAAGVVNDPRAATWCVRVRPDASGSLWLVPQLRPDPRFDYRKRDVPAASHPTIAAALARLGGVRHDDVVWDPFVGSGLELVERALLGAYARLIGTDVDPRALAAARENLSSAKIARFELVRANALCFGARGVTLVISNPPMGRRVARDGSLDALLTGFVENLGRVLAQDGRAVLLSPVPEQTRSAGERAGLRVSNGEDVDLGGFSARIQSFRRR